MLLLIMATYLLARGAWLIPSSYSEAKSALAPYRALRGAIYIAIGFVLWLLVRSAL